MKGSIVHVVSGLLVLVVFANIFIPNIALAAADIDIPVGTIVLLSVAQTIEPSAVTVGQKIHLNAVNDITIDGIVVIKAGAIASGEITQAVKAGNIGKPATIAITLRSVEAVDGTNVPIQGMKSVVGEDKQTSSLVITIICCVLGLLMKGGEAEITQGSTVEASVASSTVVSIPE